MNDEKEYDFLDKGKIDILNLQVDSERIYSQERELPRIERTLVVVAILFFLCAVPYMMALVQHAFTLMIVLVFAEAFLLWLLAKRLLNTLQNRFIRILGVTLVANVFASFVSLLGGILVIYIARLLPRYDYVYLLLIFSVFVYAKWLVYRSSWKSSAGRLNLLAMSIVVSVVIVAIFLLSIRLILPPGHKTMSSMTHQEANRNLPAIRDCQEAYKAKNGVYVECKASPARGGTDWRTDEWDDSGGFTEIGFTPDDKVCFQYTVTVNEDGQSYVITATADIDQKGTKVYTMTRDDPSPVGRRVKNWSDRKQIATYLPSVTPK